MRDTLALSGREYVIESPAEALEVFRRFYPYSWKGDASRPADFSLVADADRWHLRHGDKATGPLTGALQAAFALEHEIETRLVAESGDRIAFHAGAVEVAGRAHLIAGDADTGKTTSTLLLVELGHGFLCEELALVDWKTLAVEPHLRTLGLDASHLDEIAKHCPIERGTVDRLDDRLVRYVPYKACLEPAPLETIFLPRLRSGSGSHVAELDPAEVLPEILGYCFAPNVDEEPFFEQVIRVLESCRIVRIQFDGLETARELWRQVLPAGGPG